MLDGIQLSDIDVGLVACANANDFNLAKKKKKKKKKVVASVLQLSRFHVAFIFMQFTCRSRFSYAFCSRLPSQAVPKKAKSVTDDIGQRGDRRERRDSPE